jgi:hypothetical protein
MSPQTESTISDSVKVLSWSQLERHASQILKHFLVHMESKQFATPDLTQLIY